MKDPNNNTYFRAFNVPGTNFTVLPVCMKDGQRVGGYNNERTKIEFDVSNMDLRTEDNYDFERKKWRVSPIPEKCPNGTLKGGTTCSLPTTEANQDARYQCERTMKGVWVKPVDRVVDSTDRRPFTFGSCDDFESDILFHHEKDDKACYDESYNGKKDESINDADDCRRKEGTWRGSYHSMGSLYHLLGITEKVSSLKDACNVGYERGDRSDCKDFLSNDPLTQEKNFYGNPLARACLTGTDLKNKVGIAGYYINKSGTCAEWRNCVPWSSSTYLGEYQANIPSETENRICKTCSSSCKTMDTSAWKFKRLEDKYAGVKNEGRVPECMRNGKWTCGTYAFSNNRPCPSGYEERLYANDGKKYCYAIGRSGLGSGFICSLGDAKGAPWGTEVEGGKLPLPYPRYDGPPLYVAPKC